jgi:hypothetical protein
MKFSFYPCGIGYLGSIKALEWQGQAGVIQLFYSLLDAGRGATDLDHTFDGFIGQNIDNLCHEFPLKTQLLAPSALLVSINSSLEDVLFLTKKVRLKHGHRRY